MGYFFSDITTNELLDFVKEEYDYVKWDEKSMDKRDDYIALWGWCEDGTYEVALAIRLERTDEEVEELSNTVRGHSKVNSIEFPKSGWNVKVMNEAVGPVIQPSPIFTKARPPVTLEAKRSLKEAEECHSLINRIQEIHTDPNNKGTIQSALSCGNGQVFIWSTQGNYYIPESAYASKLAMLGILTVKYLKENNVPLQPTLEEHPHSV